MGNSIIKFSFIFGMALAVFFGCTEPNSVDNPPPAQVILVEKSSDSSAVERGIDAEQPLGVFPVPEQNAIYLEWYGLDEDDLAAYDIYRRDRDTTGNFQKIAEVPRRFGQTDTSYLDLSVNLDTVYYYYVIARDEDGQEGERSRIDFYRLLPRPKSLNAPVGNTLFQGFFEWDFDEDFVAQYFIFRLEKNNGSGEFFPYYLGLLDTEGRTQPNQRWSLEEVGLTALDPGQYRWRIDVRRFDDRNNREGSESTWETFQVQ